MYKKLKTKNKNKLAGSPKGFFVIVQMEKKTLNRTPDPWLSRRQLWSLESSSSPAVPCHPSAPLTLHVRPLSGPWEPWTLPAGPPCRQLSPMVGRRRGSLARFEPCNRQGEHITPEDKHGNISSQGAQVTAVVEDR